MKRCPNCALFVRQGAVKCPHCGVYLSRSLAGLTRTGPGVAPRSLRHASAALNADRAARQRRAVRGAVALLAIFAILVIVWRAQRLELDPSSHPIPVTFEAFDKTFGPASPLTPEQKDLEFDRYRGRYVRWEGTVLYLNTADGTEPHASLRCGADDLSSDVVLYIRPQDRDRLAARRAGDRLVCVGSLADYGQDGAPVILQDGRIIR